MRSVALLLPLALLQSPPEPSLDTLLARFSDYLVRYEPAISAVIADEKMVQRDRFTRFTYRTARRKLKSEVAFMRLPGGGEWIGFRLVHEVDGRKIAEQPRRLQALLSGTGDDYRRGIAIAFESARHNLGPRRTTNVPLLAFHLLHPQNRDRFAYRRHGPDLVAGRPLWQVDFEEISKPTIIQSPQGQDIVSRSSVWLDLTSGAVYQTLVSQHDAVGPARLRVSFREHHGLGILVPERMWEEFPIGGLIGEGDARYSNFRRFTTSARIVPQ